MIRNFFRHLRQSFVSLRRQGWMTFAAVSTVSITLTLVGIFTAVLLNMNKMVNDVENNMVINVYLEPNVADNNETDANGKPNSGYHKIYDQLKAVDGVTDISYSTKQEQYEALIKKYGDVWGYDESSNPLYNTYIVKVNSLDKMKDMAAQFKQIQGVNDARYGDIDVDRLASLAKSIRFWGLIGTGLLVLVAIFLISNTIRITIMARKDDIVIMRLVGAKNSYIRTPFFFEGAWIGILGSIVPGLVLYFGYNIVEKGLGPGLQGDNLSLYAVNPYLYYLIGALVLIGVVIGAIGSMISIRRYLKA